MKLYRLVIYDLVHLCTAPYPLPLTVTNRTVSYRDTETLKETPPALICGYLIRDGKKQAPLLLVVVVLAGVWLMIIYGSVVSSIPVCNLELAFCHHHHDAVTTGDYAWSSNQPMRILFKKPKRATNG